MILNSINFYKFRGLPNFWNFVGT